MAEDAREELRSLLRDAKLAAERNGDSTFDQQVSAILAWPDVVLRALGALCTYEGEDHREWHHVTMIEQDETCCQWHHAQCGIGGGYCCNQCPRFPFKEAI